MKTLTLRTSTPSLSSGTTSKNVGRGRSESDEVTRVVRCCGSGVALPQSINQSINHSIELLVKVFVGWLPQDVREHPQALRQPLPRRGRRRIRGARRRGRDDDRAPQDNESNEHSPAFRSIGPRPLTFV